MVETILCALATLSALRGRRWLALILAGLSLSAFSYDFRFGHSHLVLLMAPMLAAPAVAYGLHRRPVAYAVPVALFCLGIIAEGGPLDFCRGFADGFQRGYEKAAAR